MTPGCGQSIPDKIPRIEEYKIHFVHFWPLLIGGILHDQLQLGPF